MMFTTELAIPLLAAGLVFVSIFLVINAFSGAAGGSDASSRIRGRLAVASGKANQPKGLASVFGFIGDSLSGLVGLIGRHLGEQDPAQATQLRLQLMQAGLRTANAALYFIGIRAVLMVVGLGGPLLVRVIDPLIINPQYFALFLSGSAIGGYYLPVVWLRSAREKRQNLILKELPEILDLMVVCVEAGMGLDQTLKRVAEETRETCKNISLEIRMVNLELRAGKSRHEALRNMALRIGLDDMDSLVTLLIQADTFGTSMATTLRVYSESLRTKRFQRAEEQASKLPAKLLIPLILFFMPALFVVIIGPASIRLMDVFSRMP